MKKTIAVILVLIAVFPLPACGKNDAAAKTPPVETAAPTAAAVSTGADAVDVDLTQLSSTMVYSEVFAMMSEPERYLGKTVKMKGAFSAFTGTTGKLYNACIVQDATACCAQGLEFELSDGSACPEPGTEITVVGTFDTYREEYDGNYYLYIILKDAALI